VGFAGGKVLESWLRVIKEIRQSSQPLRAQTVVFASRPGLATHLRLLAHFGQKMLTSPYLTFIVRARGTLEEISRGITWNSEPLALEILGTW